MTQEQIVVADLSGILEDTFNRILRQNQCGYVSSANVECTEPQSEGDFCARHNHMSQDGLPVYCRFCQWTVNSTTIPKPWEECLD